MAEDWPAKLLDSADVNDPVVEVVHELGHVLLQEPLVCVHRVTWGGEEHEDGKRQASVIVSLRLLLLTSKGTLSRGGVLPDEGQELVLGLFQGDFTVSNSLGQS